MVSAKIYLCKYIEVKQPFPRHHLSGYAKCEFLRKVELDDLSFILPSNYIEKLLEDKELIVIEKQLIEKLISNKADENVYIRITL